MKRFKKTPIYLSLAFLLVAFTFDSYPENRVAIKKSLQGKTAAKKSLVVHLLVPLCDNEHQGIVPTTASLGNGMSLKSNLYWATSKGVKRYFKEQKQWKLIKSILDPNKNVLERVIFEKRYSDGKKVTLVADAYRGDRMKVCLDDYFKALSGSLKDSVKADNGAWGIYGHADMVAFNGHNGLMDEEVTVRPVKNNRNIDAVVIACASQGYFNRELKKVNAYPLVTTTNLLYPGAPVMHDIIDAWAALKSAEDVRKAAGAGYYRMKPKSGPNGSLNLFATGW